MKKLIFAFSALSLVFVSCSSDADPLPVIEPVDTTGSTSSILIKKRIHTEPGSPPETYNYIYNGNKLLKITDGFGESNITYSGNLITKVEHFDNTLILEESDHFTYNSSNKMIANVSKHVISDTGYKEIYLYNSDGTITANKYQGNATTQTTFTGSYKLFLQNNEVVKCEEYNSTGSLFNTINYTYDGKNNPFKNIIGWSNVSFTKDRLGGIFQNVVTEVSNFNNFNNTYTYNSSNFPTLETTKDNSNVTQSTTQYFY